MGNFTVKEKIAAPVQEVWRILSDVGNIYQWNPGVEKSHCTNSVHGLGASRRCELKGNNFLEEDVVKWEENKYLTMRIKETDLPFKTADIHFTLTEQADGTLVSVQPVYEPKYGILGKFLNTIYVQGFYQKGMQSLLSGLKSRVETNSTDEST